MAEFSFYSSWEDSLDILKSFVDTHQFTFLINKVYRENRFIWFDEPNQDIISKLNHDIGSVFLWSKKFSIYPPAYRQYSDELIDIIPNLSGPALGLFLAKGGINKETGEHQLGRGWVDYPRTFYNPETGQPYQTPEALKTAFAEAKKIIMRHCEKRFIPFRRITAKGKIIPTIDTLWIGKKGLSLVEKGEAVVMLNHNDWLTSENLSKRRSDLASYLEEAKCYYGDC